MSPKGGIQPHDKFSIKATRSEVLFVDYIAEHLKLKGRAGIIVPEGIVANPGSAYVQLRKMLVDGGYLHSVISLPAGIFNPYSAVKTSMLIFDRDRAKQAGEILFLKLGRDGYSLGSQRTKLCDDNGERPEWCRDHSDLAVARDVAREWRAGRKGDTPIASWVSKAEIAERGDYILVGDHYRLSENLDSAWPLRKFEDVCTLEYGSALPKGQRIDGPYPVMGSNGISGFHDKYLIEGPAIIVGRKGSAGEVTWVDNHCYPIDTTFYVRRNDIDTANLKYLYYLLKSLNLADLKGGAGVPGLSRNDVYAKCRLPMPPVEIQEALVAEIEAYQDSINFKRAEIADLEKSIERTIRGVWRQATIDGKKNNLDLSDEEAA